MASSAAVSRSGAALSRLCVWAAQRASIHASSSPTEYRSRPSMVSHSPAALRPQYLPTAAPWSLVRGHNSMGRRCASSRSKEAIELDEAIGKVRAGSGRKFVESCDVVVALNIDPRKADQALRGLAVLPHGTGKELKVAVFAEGPAADAAVEAGATHVGSKELVDKVADGFLDFERCVATPAAMKMLSKVARILGPRGLMPNAKLGTVTDNVAEKVKELQKGVQLRAEKAGLIHATFGRINMEESQLKENLKAIVDQLVSMRPRGIKEPYVKDCFLSTTMGPSYKVSVGSLLATTGSKEGAAVQKTTGKKGKASHAINPADWATVDLDTIRSKKLRRYLEARRASAAATGDSQQQASG